MKESVHTLEFATIGDVLKKYRKQSNLSISQLARLTGVHKGVIAKIENGSTRRPGLKITMPLAKVLNIPTDKIVELYIEIDKRPEVLFGLLNEAIRLFNVPLAARVAQRILETPYEESYSLMERLYNFVSSLSDLRFQLPLYHVIIKYARERGMQRFLAKGLLNKYLIERDDFNRLEETYYTGEEILHYVDFLSNEEKVTIYYKMAFHAHAMKKYEKCIEFGKMGHAADLTHNELKERVALAICNSYMFLGDCRALEQHLDLFEKLDYRFIIERIKFFRGTVYSRTGKYEEAIPLLRGCLVETTEVNRIFRLTELFDALCKVSDLNSIKSFLEEEEKKIQIFDNDPYQYSELGRFYKLKGNYFMTNGLIDEGMEAYMQSIYYFEKIGALKLIM
ncbi:helix-turn-helix domain-containing protein [Brevibacillus borstelensis]|uniref:helix-turn-helix domain-containing protein n=1 Tax=Brevibacillus borstelensis TaxID=45462 RepID=UPI003CF00199